MKILERRLVIQDWYETESTKTGWDSHGWKFLDDYEYISYMGWAVVDILKTDIHYNPTLAIAEKETEI